MSISAAQMIPQVASTEGPAAARRSSPAPSGAGAQPSVPAAPAVAPPAPSPTPAPPAQFSTDLRVDAEHQLYYEVVDDATGDVLFEIPPEALRNIGESLNVPLMGDSGAHSFDAKS